MDHCKHGIQAIYPRCSECLKQDEIERLRSENRRLIEKDSRMLSLLERAAAFIEFFYADPCRERGAGNWLDDFDRFMGSREIHLGQRTSPSGKIASER